jgi:hypothetical protein
MAAVRFGSARAVSPCPSGENRVLPGRGPILSWNTAWNCVVAIAPIEPDFDCESARWSQSGILRIASNTRAGVRIGATAPYPVHFNAVATAA